MMWQEARLTNALVNAVLALYGEPEPRGDEEIIHIAQRLDRLADQRRLADHHDERGQQVAGREPEQAEQGDEGRAHGPGF